jgi:3-hydroxybutyryl-CoA dehydrogenase
MGSGIVEVAAKAGFDVVVTEMGEEALEAGRKRVRRSMDVAVERGKLASEEADAAWGRITFGTDLSLMADRDLVIEAIVEDMEAKNRLFRTLDGSCGDHTILASNTSSLTVTEMAAPTGRPDRVVGLHFFNPVPVMKLVEVIKGLATSEDVTNRTIALAEKMGKTAVPANDRPGFVSNRVLMPMINEAFFAWMEGVAEPADIDEIMKLGMAHPMGPLRLADFIGLDTCVHIMDVLADGLNNDRYRACPILKQLVAAGRLGDKTGRGVFEYGKG